MKSVRLDANLEGRLEEAARLSGVSVSHFIRAAIRDKCDEILGQRLDQTIADLLGSVQSTGGDSRQTGRDFTGALKRRASRKRKAG